MKLYFQMLYLRWKAKRAYLKGSPILSVSEYDDLDVTIRGFWK